MSPLAPLFSPPVPRSLSVLLLSLIGLKGACFLPVFCQAKLNISKQQQLKDTPRQPPTEAPDLLKEAPEGTRAETKPEFLHAGR